MKKLIIASNNKGKISEIASILEGRYEVVSMQEAGLDVDIAETGTTFEQNAVIKARECYRLTGEASLAADSGLEVLALGGARAAYGEIMSETAKQFLLSQGIAVQYGKCVGAIAGRVEGTTCPIEGSVLDIDDPTKGLTAIEDRLALLRGGGSKP